MRYSRHYTEYLLQISIILQRSWRRGGPARFSSESGDPRVRERRLVHCISFQRTEANRWRGASRIVVTSCLM